MNSETSVSKKIQSRLTNFLTQMSEDSEKKDSVCDRDNSFTNGWDAFDDLLAFDDSFPGESNTTLEDDSSTIKSSENTRTSFSGSLVPEENVETNKIKVSQEKLKVEVPTSQSSTSYDELENSSKPLQNVSSILKFSDSGGGKIKECSKFVVNDLQKELMNSKPLGFDDSAADLITEGESLLMCNVNSINSNEQYEHAKTKLHKLRLSILEKFYKAFEAIPSSVLEKCPGFDKCVCNMLKNMYQGIGHKLLLMENLSGIHKNCSPNKNPPLGELYKSPEKLKSTLNNTFLPSTSKAVPAQCSYSPNQPVIKQDFNSSVSKSNETKPTISSSFKFKRPSNLALKSPSDNTLKTESSSVNKFISKKLDYDSDHIPSTAHVSPSSKNPAINKLATPIFKSVKQKLVPDNDRHSHDLNDYFCTKPDKKRLDASFEEESKKDDYFIEPASPEQPKGRRSVPSQSSNTSRLPPIQNTFQDDNKFMDSSSVENKSENVTSSGEYNYIGKFSPGTINDGVTREFDGTSFPHSQEMLKVFRETFGLFSFRPCQLQAINAILLMHDCFILMPTGGGKSLCYQLPAVLSPGVTIVVSPLKSLILDQVQKLNALDIPAARLSGVQKEENEIYLSLSRREIRLKLLYVTPEKLVASERCMDMLQSLFARDKISRFVIDEVHCMSQWGHDFRPDYKKLNTLRHTFPSVPIVALTATATQRVRQDILLNLRLRNPKWFICSFNRPNLQFEVLDKRPKNVVNDAINLIKDKFSRESGIIYCLSQKECETTTKQLNQAGIKAGTYHAGLPDPERARVQQVWLSNKIKVVCATIAFGMGIDKPDVRFVIHLSLPKSLEGLYQEAGRAGRDGKTAKCVLFYNYSDVFRHRRLMESGIQDRWRNGGVATDSAVKQIHEENLKRIIYYCQNRTECRRVLQLNYFGEIFNKQECLRRKDTTCDNCHRADDFQDTDFTKEAQEIVRCFGSSQLSHRNLTIVQLVDVIKGRQISKLITMGYTSLPLYGLGKTWDPKDITNLLIHLTIKGFLVEQYVQTKADTTTGYLRLGPNAGPLLQNKVKVMLKTKKTNNNTNTTSNPQNMQENPFEEQLKNIQEQCYAALMDVCQGFAESLGVGANSIMNVLAIKKMSESLPVTDDEMLKIPHVTLANFEKFGKSLLEVTRQYSTQRFVVLCEQDEAQEQIEEAANDSHFDLIDGFPDGFSANVSSSSTNKRKRVGGTSKPAKRGRKKGARTYRGKNVKKSGTGRGFNFSGSAGARNSAYSSGRGKNSAGASSSSKTPGFMPMTVPSQFPPSKRPGFLPQPKVFTL